MSEAVEQITDASIESEWDSLEDDAPVLEEVSDEDTGEETTDNVLEEETESDSNDTDESSSESNEDSSEAVDEDGSGKDETTEEVKSLDINELGDDATVKVKVDGELQEISLKEFKNGISGSKAIAQKFNELDRAKKEYETEISAVNEYVNTFGEKMRQGDTMGALEYLGSFSGMGPHQIRQQLINGLLPEIERLNSLSQSEIDLEYQRAETDYIKQQRESEQQRYQQEQAQAELHSKITEVRDSLSIEDAEWEAAIASLDERLPADQQITPELVGQEVQMFRAYDRAESVIGQIDENLLNDTNIEILMDTITDYPHFTEEELIDLCKEAFGVAQESLVEEKISKQVKKAEKSTPKQEVSNNNEMYQELDADDWDDIF